MKIKGSTKVLLSSFDNSTKVLLSKDDNKYYKCDCLSNIIGYLFNNSLIELPDEYWIEDDNGWKSKYYKNYRKIFKDFDKLILDKSYKLTLV